MSPLPFLSCSIVFLLVFPVPGRGDYALQDGDTVVFLGDSITAARTYGKIIENYTLLRFPERKVRFHNAGWGGDTAAGGLARLERDVFRQGANVLIVAYGFNDIGWGLHADQEHKKKYLNAIGGIIDACQKRKVRVFLCSAAVTAADPATSEESFLQEMCDEGMALAREKGEQAIDVQRSMRAIQKKVWAFNATLKEEKSRESLHARDGVHLNDLGHLAMAFAILQGLGAPAEVSSVTVDARGPRLVEARGCQVTGLKKSTEGLEFIRLDQGRPINFGLFGALPFRFVPIPDQLNRYLLAVHHLPEGRYEVQVEGRLLGTFTSQQLSVGLNIASLTPDPWQPGGPWDAEATILSHLTEARSEVGLARMFTNLYRTTHPHRATLNLQTEKVNAGLVEPVPYRFIVRPTLKKK